jgi:rRNA maturation endonuclease Nob1
VKCVGCGEKKEFKNEELPADQPFCDVCGMPMIAEKAELFDRK